MRTYAPAGDGEKLTARGIDSDGKSTLVQYTAKYDGRDYAITGSSGGNLDLVDTDRQPDDAVFTEARRQSRHRRHAHCVPKTEKR